MRCQEVDASERATVEAWVAASPANAAELERLRQAWRARGGGGWNVDAAWAKVESRLDHARAVTPIQSRQSQSLNPLLRIAAAVVLVTGITLVWRGRRPEPLPPPLVYATAIGERQSIELSDGTKVTLGPASELRVDSEYNRQGRRVDLTGEAWFEVHHDAAQSFRVHAAGTITEDLGTSFSVRALEADSIVRVVLVEGAAAVGLETTPVSSRSTLRPRDAADINVKAERVTVRNGVDVESLVAWRSGAVAFNDTPLSEVSAELQRWYGVTMTFASPDLARRTVSYTMPTNDITDAIEVLGKSTGVTIERRGDVLFVR
jgi:transmembrane sensor